MTAVKICGLSTRETVDAAIQAGAGHLGFVFVPSSPRALDPERAVPLFRRARGRARIVALLADPSNELLDEVVRALDPDMLQLHGAETPEQVAAIRESYSLPVIKALGVRQGADLDSAPAYEGVADHLMLDAKPPEGAVRTGGHGRAFDWSILEGRTPSKPWFLAGGLTPDNVAAAVRATGAPMVDVSSGVESSPGVKDPALIAAFLRAARSA